MGLNLDDLLADLEQTEKSASDKLEDELKETSETKEASAEEKTEEATEEKVAKEVGDKAEESEKSEEKVAEATDEEKDLMKVAQELEVQGRIMARGFYDELTKLASKGNVETEDDSEELPTKSASFADEVANKLSTKYSQ